MNQAPREDRSTIDWPAAFAGAAAAVTVGVLLSTLGAAGTLVGAALGSVVATVSTALYKQGIQSSRRKMAEVQATALQRVGMAQEEVRRAAAHSDSSTVASDLARADAHLADASSELGDTGEQATSSAATPVAAAAAVPAAAPAASSSLSWRRTALLTAAVFVVAMVVISGFEVFAGKSLASLIGGSDDKRTSITGLFGDTTRHGGSSPSPTATVTVTATTSATPTPTPTSASTSATPTGSEQPSDTASPTDTASATDTASTSPTPVATGTGTP